MIARLGRLWKKPRASLAAGGVALFGLGVMAGRVSVPYAEAEPVAARVAAIGGPGTGETERRRFPVRYAALKAREEAAAAIADSLLSHVPSAVPVEGAVLTSGFTQRRFHPVLRRVRPHWGVDLAAPAGTPVRAAGDGVVLYWVRNPSYGLVVDISHGERGEFISRYAHLSVVSVRRGERVRRGQVIGRVGSTGLTTGPHLHYEAFANGRRRDPALLFDAQAAESLIP